MCCGATDPNIPRSEPCSKSVDVVFVIDSSIYLDFDKLQTYVVGVIRDIVAHLRVDTGHTRVAAVTYSRSATVWEAPTLWRNIIVYFKEFFVLHTQGSQWKR